MAVVAARWAYPSSLLLLHLTVINAHFVWAAAEGRTDRRSLADPPVRHCGAGGGGKRSGTLSLFGTPHGVPKSSACGRSPGAVVLTRACALPSPHWSRLATNQRQRDSRKIPPRTRAVCTQWRRRGVEKGAGSDTRQRSVTDRDWVSHERTQRYGKTRLTRRNDPVQFCFIFSLLKRQFYERK